VHDPDGAVGRAVVLFALPLEDYERLSHGDASIARLPIVSSPSSNTGTRRKAGRVRAVPLAA
jgi:hypothetical protein